VHKSHISSPKHYELYKEPACHSKFQDFNYPTLVKCTLLLCSAKIMLHTTLVSHMNLSILTVNIPGQAEKKIRERN